MHGFLRANLLHEKLTIHSERPQPSSERRLVIGIEASHRRSSDHDEFSRVGLQPFLLVLLENPKFHF